MPTPPPSASKPTNALPPPTGESFPPARANTPSRLAAGFGHVLRGIGIGVSASETIGFAEALAVVGVTDRESVYWAGRALFTHSPDDIEAYDRAFVAYWEQPGVADDEWTPPPVPITIVVDADDTDEDEPAGTPTADDEPMIELRFSAHEVLRDKDFSTYTDADLREASELMRHMQLFGAPRRSLRTTPTRRNGKQIDLRRTVGGALRADGEVIKLERRTHATRHRRLVLLLDVSGSMEPYARALIRFAHAAVVGRQRVEVFALGTRLTRITRELSSRDPDRALRAAADEVVDYGGGTRLGDGLQLFNDRWGQSGMTHGAIVVILSDGWDRGDPKLLGTQMERLHRSAFRVVWVNPLKITPGYAPLARGMQAALPHVDSFIEGHSIDALTELARVVADETRRDGVRRFQAATARPG